MGLILGMCVCKVESNFRDNLKYILSNTVWGDLY